jgi:hypothetical protein
MIRYFLQPRWGPWYEIETPQWVELGLPGAMVGQPMEGYEIGTPIMRCVVIDTTIAVREDVKEGFPGLQDLVWFPDMRCGDCNGRLVDENAFDPDIRWPRYVHATATIDRHGAWPVERWDD